jgi:hypothetical protein
MVLCKINELIGYQLANPNTLLKVRKKNENITKSNKSQHQWLTPVILATQEDRGSKPAWVNSLRGPTWKKTFTKKGCGVAQGVGPEFKTQYCKRKKKYE